MKELNPLEKILNSWVPRRPSDRIRRRLFRDLKEPRRVDRPPRIAWSWLAPVTACLILSVFSVAGLLTSRITTGLPLVSLDAFAVTNQIDCDSKGLRLAAYQRPQFHSDRNRLPRYTFDSTNLAISLPTIDPLPQSRTNGVLRD